MNEPFFLKFGSIKHCFPALNQGVWFVNYTMTANTPYFFLNLQIVNMSVECNLKFV